MPPTTTQLGRRVKKLATAGMQSAMLTWVKQKTLLRMCLAPAVKGDDDGLGVQNTRERQSSDSSILPGEAASGQESMAAAEGIKSQEAQVSEGMGNASSPSSASAVDMSDSASQSCSISPPLTPGHATVTFSSVAYASSSATSDSSAAMGAGSEDEADSSMAELVWRTWGVCLNSRRTDSSSAGRNAGDTDHLTVNQLEQLTLMTVWGLSESLDDLQLLLQQLATAPICSLGEPAGTELRRVSIPFTMPLKGIVPVALGSASPAHLPTIVLDSSTGGSSEQSVVEQLFGSSYAAGCKPREAAEAYTALGRGCGLLSKVLAVHQLPGRLLFVMESRGSNTVNLAHWLQQLQQEHPGASHLEAAAVLHIVKQLAAALHFLHQQEVIYNGLMPWNILVYSKRSKSSGGCGSSGATKDPAVWVMDGSRSWKRQIPLKKEVSSTGTGDGGQQSSCTTGSDGENGATTSTISSCGTDQMSPTNPGSNGSSKLIPAACFNMYLAGQICWVRQGGGYSRSMDYAALGYVLLFLLCFGNDAKYQQLIQLLQSAHGRAGGSTVAFRALLQKSFRRQVGELPGDGDGGCVAWRLVDLVMQLVVPEEWQQQPDSGQVLQKMLWQFSTV